MKNLHYNFFFYVGAVFFILIERKVHLIFGSLGFLISRIVLVDQSFKLIKFLYSYITTLQNFAKNKNKKKQPSYTQKTTITHKKSKFLI